MLEILPSFINSGKSTIVRCTIIYVPLRKKNCCQLNYDTVLMYHLDFQFFLKKSVFDLHIAFLKITQNPSRKQRAPSKGKSSVEGLMKRIFTKGVGWVEGNQLGRVRPQGWQ